MAHYAFLDSNDIVVSVIVGKEEGTDGIDWEQKYGEIKNLTCKRTSYNTIANTHKEGGTPFRGNYAGIGYTYDSENDVFYPPKPHESWTLNTDTWTWEAPLSYPSDNLSYAWNEEAYQADNSTGWERFIP
jgi:hypothetical protein